jgi:hypothetical protein
VGIFSKIFGVKKQIKLPTTITTITTDEQEHDWVVDQLTNPEEVVIEDWSNEILPCGTRVMRMEPIIQRRPMTHDEKVMREQLRRKGKIK